MFGDHRTTIIADKLLFELMPLLPKLSADDEHAHSMVQHTLEAAAKFTGHASTTTTQLYDRRSDELSLDEIERIRY